MIHNKQLQRRQYSNIQNLHVHKLNDEVSFINKRLIEYTSDLQNRLNTYMKEHLTNFVELKAQLNKQNESTVYLNKEFLHHNKLFDQMQGEIEAFKSQKDLIKNRFEMLNDEIESRISNKNFYEIINKIDYSRTKDHESIKLELFEFKRLLENRFQILTQSNEDITSHHFYQSKQISAMDEKLQGHYSSLNERISAFTKSFLELQISISNNQDIWKKAFSGNFVLLQIVDFTDQQTQTISQLQSNNKKDFLRVTSDIQTFKEKVVKLHQEEIDLKISSIRDNLARDIQVICEKVVNNLSEDRGLQQHKNMQDEEIQVELMPVKMIYSKNMAESKQSENIKIEKKRESEIQRRKPNQTALFQQINMEHIQELIEKTVFELINETLATSSVLKEQASFIMEKQKQDTLDILKSEISQQIKNVINTMDKRQKEIKHVQKLREIQQIQQQLQDQVQIANQQQNIPSKQPSQQSSPFIPSTFISSDILDSIDEIKAEIQILNELREEIDQKLSLNNVEVKQLALKLDKQSTQILKIKSDLVTETEYLNGQIRLLFKEKDSNLRRMSSISHLFAAVTESLFVILSVQLQTLTHESAFVRFQSLNEGIIYELVSDAENEPTPISYRSQKFTVQELLKKTFFGNLDLWNFYFESESFPEVKDFHPSAFFKSNIQKENNFMFKNNGASPMNISRTTGEFVRASCTMNNKLLLENTLSVRDSRKSNVRIQKPQSQQQPKRDRSSMTVYKFMKQEKFRENQSANSKRQS